MLGDRPDGGVRDPRNGLGDRSTRRWIGSIKEPRAGVGIERDMPVTIPNGSTPPGEQPDPSSHGNGSLWTTFWPFGVIVAGHDALRPDGSMEIKFPWWRAVRGELTIHGLRLDRPAPPLRSDISSYGPTGFQASGVIFPTEGCWEVTGSAGPTSLTFVVIVVRTTRWALTPQDIGVPR